MRLWQSWTKFCRQIHKVLNVLNVLSFECFTDFWKFSSAIVEIWFLVGWLVTCHQFQTFLGFSGNFISDFNEKIFQTSHIVLGVLQNHQYNVEQYKRIC